MFTTRNNQTEEIRFQAQAIPKTFISNVFSWMGIALAITAFTAWYFASNKNLMDLLYIKQVGMTGFGWFVMLAPLGFVLLMGMGFQRFSAQTLTLFFVIFAILIGMSLSFILLIYTAASVFQTFAITSAMFILMAFIGYTTKTDLTKFGSLLMMGVFGIIIASVVNWFLKSTQLEWIISFIGVIVFTGLIAYDVQKLKRIGAGVEYGTETTKKLTIMGALSLYLDFINLFLFLLRFLGNRK